MIGFLVLVAVIIASSVWLYLSRRQEETKKIPGLAPTSKEEGNLSDIRAAGGLQNFLAKLHHEMGPIVSFWYGRVYTVSISSPELFKQHMQPFDRPLLLFEFFRPLFGDASIQFVNGEDGRLRRKIYDRAFAHDRFGLYFKTFQRCAEVTVTKWQEREEDDAIPLWEETFRFAVRSAMCSMLGEYCEDEKIISDFIQAYLTTQEELAKVLGDPSHVEKAQTNQKFNEALAYMKEIVKSAVEHHRQSALHGYLLVDEVLEYTSDEDIILDDCVTYLISSFHTVGNMMASGLFFLAQHEEVQEKLYKEFKQLLGEDGIVEKSNLKDFKYMRQVIDECVRCGAFGTFAARYQEVDITLGGYLVPKNTPVIQAVGALMMNEQYWTNPKEFNPDRFNEENSKTRSPFAFKPFGFSGKRICPGAKLVHPKCAVFMATVLRSFKIKLHGDQELEFEHGLATHTTAEMWAKLEKRC